MAKTRVLVTRRIPEAGLEAIKSFADVELWSGEEPIPRNELCEKVSEVDGLYCLLTDTIDEALLSLAPRLRVVSTMAVGFDHIDIQACTKRKIPVGNTPGVLTETTADFAFALLMAAGRRIGEAAEFVKAGRWGAWDPALFVGQDVNGATAGIIGFGRIGQAVAKRAHGFGMRVLVNHSRPIPSELLAQANVEQVSFDRVIAESDFLSLHVPLTSETQQLIDKKVLNRMKRTAILINTSRGRVVDSKALYDALRNQNIAYAALDVTDPEPISVDDPLLTLPNCLVVPHIASASVATRRKMALMAAENLRAGLAGEDLPYCVNPEVFKK
ncbi:D-glycerate dehydrogenase [Candidatus Nitronereus thalassa]|uniref:D-glycerate dehydrogenase n=1 Tax=Candidatus Nitronereus thalassa TaxID=3020898 RepID=A0ABU3K6N9_9BACT|nr:D-glycerate dehydrogenase [Candidatus Nitronereus thalassa]MDT7042036.1 D-glycerate dehydrogenase [Candidatus Nitronereus thalassa]